MSLRDRLERLEGAVKKSGSERLVPESMDWIAPLERELNVRVLQKENSFFLLKEAVHPVLNNPAFAYLQQKGFQTDCFYRLVGLEREQPLPLRRAVFFDLETTGLAGGTGTYAFLIGVGTLESDAIRLRQYILPDYSHEWVLLDHLQLLFREYPFTISFNGKTFDIPLLGNRFVLNQMENVLEEKLHIDLLHAARRIWRRVLPSCDLQQLEKEILQVERVDDIPGELIPQIFFDFIRKRDAWLLGDILEHNYHDIVNMVLLGVYLAAVAEDPLQFLNSPREIAALADYYFRRRWDEPALPLLKYLIHRSQHFPVRLNMQPFFQLAMILKRQGKPREATEYLWRLMKQNVTHPMVIEELAKFYEHREKNYPLALEIVERGLNRLRQMEQLDRGKVKGRYFQALEHRRQRLRNKIARQQTGTPRHRNCWTNNG